MPDKLLTNETKTVMQYLHSCVYTQLHFDIANVWNMQLAWINRYAETTNFVEAILLENSWILARGILDE